MTLLEALGGLKVVVPVLLLFHVAMYVIGYFFFYRGPFGFHAIEEDSFNICAASLCANDSIIYGESIRYVRENFGEKYVKKLQQKLRDHGYTLPDDKLKKQRPSYLRLV